jgi:dihydrofolate reductase
MPSIGLVWAQSLPRPGRPALIGREGTLPWRLPEDLAHFRELTTGHPVIMGRRTWESLPAQFRPLPGRENIVLSTSAECPVPGAQLVADPGAALELTGARDVWVIGGASVYAAFLPMADRLEITEVDLDLGPVQPGDVFAPGVSGDRWDRVDGPWRRSHSGLRYRIRRLTARTR